MDPPEHYFAGDIPSPGRRSELLGPRPTRLRVNRDSHVIRKPPVAPPHHPRQAPPPHAAAATTTMNTTGQNSQPVIIYAVSPKVIHTTVSDFMNLVQRLTGSSSTSTSTSATGGDISPAARLASIERASPSERERASNAAAAVAAAPVTIDDESAMNEEVMRILGEANVQVGESHIPSILSPAPETLPPVSPAGMFSPMTDPFMQVSNMFIPSPSTLYAAPIASPSPSSSFDLCLFDF